MTKLLLIFLITFSNHSMAEWVEYSTRSNGDVFYFDNASVENDANYVSVWNRVRYKTSLMGASSYQSFLKIDCTKGTETTLQSTFYSDKNWAMPAMATNTREKPAISIDSDSATELLADILCNE